MYVTDVTLHMLRLQPYMRKKEIEVYLILSHVLGSPQQMCKYIYIIFPTFASLHQIIDPSNLCRTWLVDSNGEIEFSMGKTNQVCRGSIYVR